MNIFDQYNDTYSVQRSIYPWLKMKTKSKYLNLKEKKNQIEVYFEFNGIFYFSL